MNTKILEYIIAIAQERSISKAAERFYLTQPVLSRHLRKIEEGLGTPLFLRQKGGMELTEAGRIYINSAQNILHLEAELSRDLNAIREQERTSLHLYAEQPFSQLLSEWVLPGFHEKYPDVQVRITFGTAEEVQASLSNGETGIGVLTTDGRLDPELGYATLYKDELVLLRPDSKRGLDTVFLQPEGTTLRALEDQWLREAGLFFSTVMEVSTFRAGVEGLQRGQGCASVLKSLADRLGLAPFPGIPPLPFQVLAAYPKNMVFHPSLRFLLQEILRVFDDWSFATSQPV